MGELVKGVVHILIIAITSLAGMKIIAMTFGIYEMDIGFINRPVISEDKDPLLFRYVLTFFCGVAVLYIIAIYENAKAFQKYTREKLYEIKEYLKMNRT